MHSPFSYPQAIDDNFFSALALNTQMCYKICAKIFLLGPRSGVKRRADARDDGCNHVNGFWLYFMACSCSWRWLLLLFCLFANAVHGCIINYAYQNAVRGKNFCQLTGKRPSLTSLTLSRSLVRPPSACWPSLWLSRKQAGSECN